MSSSQSNVGAAAARDGITQRDIRTVFSEQRALADSATRSSATPARFALPTDTPNNQYANQESLCEFTFALYDRSSGDLLHRGPARRACCSALVRETTPRQVKSPDSCMGIPKSSRMSRR